MTIGIWVLGDQLSASQAALCSSSPEDSRVLLVESNSVLSNRAYHQQKLVLVWSAMRHFAADLGAHGWRVDYHESDCFSDVLPNWLASHQITELRIMEPEDRGFRAAIERLHVSVPLVWLPSNAFLWSREDFAAWASGYKQLRMELFYREGRRRFGVLMQPDGTGLAPLGGQWNYDHDNRKSPPKGMRGLELLWFQPDGITGAAIETLRKTKHASAGLGWAPRPRDRFHVCWG